MPFNLDESMTFFYINLVTYIHVYSMCCQISTCRLNVHIWCRFDELTSTLRQKGTQANLFLPINFHIALPSSFSSSNLIETFFILLTYLSLPNSNDISVGVNRLILPSSCKIWAKLWRKKGKEFLFCLKHFYLNTDKLSQSLF